MILIKNSAYIWSVCRFETLQCVTLCESISSIGLSRRNKLTMKQLLLIVLCLSYALLINNNCLAQDSPDKQQRGLHTIYAEALGNAIFYSIGYDYTLKSQEIHKLSFKFGFGYVPIDWENIRLKFNIFHLPISPEISYLYGKKHHLELGVGVTYIANFDFYRGGFFGSNHDWTIPFRMGYRYQKDNGGFFLKAAATPFIWFMNHQDTEDSDPELWKFFIPFGGVAIGYTFKSR